MTEPPRPKAIAAPRTLGARFRIRTVGQKVTPFEDLYHFVLSRPWRHFFALTIGAYLVANAFFAGLYLLAPGSINNARPGAFSDAFFFSVQTMSTIGYGGMTPAGLYGNALVTLEAMLGMLAVALVTGITFAKFARPTSRVLFSSKVVINPRDGVPHVHFRMANWRHNQIVEAQLRVVVLVSETTREGDTLRRPLELPLVRDRTTFFGLTWTAMHRIDEASPFYGPDAVARLRGRGAEFYLSLTGHDETFAQTVHARHLYSCDDVVTDARFANVLTIEPDGTRVIDYTRFHEVVPVSGA